MKKLTILFFVLCIVSGFIQDKISIDSRIMIFLCFAFFLSGMNFLIIINSSKIPALKKYEVIETPEYCKCIPVGAVVTEEPSPKHYKSAYYTFFCTKHNENHRLYRIQVEGGRFYKEI